MDKDILRVKKFEKKTNCMLINVNLNKKHFDSFTEIIKIENPLIDIKNKLSDKEKLISRLNHKIKRIHDTSLECKNLIV